MPDGSVPQDPDYPILCGHDATTNGCGGFGSSWTFDRTTGAYSITGLNAGTYQIGFIYEGVDRGIIYQIWWGGDWNQDTAPSHVITGGQDVTVDLQFIRGATISGSLTGADAALTNPQVGAYRLDGSDNPFAQMSYDASSQTYRIVGVAPGTYRVGFSDSPRYVTSFWNHATTGATATKITVSAAQNLTGIDAVLAHSTSVSGHVTVSDGSAYGGYVYLFTVPPGQFSTGPPGVFVDRAGNYELDEVPPGTYRVCATGGGPFVEGCWGGGSDSTAPTITVADGDVVTGKDMTVTVGGVISGTVETIDEIGDTPVPLAEPDVDLWSLNDAGTKFELFRSGSAGTDGKFNFEQVPVGTYRLQARDPSGNHNSQWWDHEVIASDGDDITVAANSTVELGDIVLMPRGFYTQRTWGDDRFSGAVQMTQAAFPTGDPKDPDYPREGVPAAGAPVVYVANGLNYPDALSAGPAAIFQHGVLLLTLPTSIPAVVSAEIKRLHPQKIVIVGGPASVSAGVEQQLKSTLYVADPSDVIRETGDDRFAASRHLAEAVWGGAGGSGAPEVFIATGNNFPDALDAGPAAGTISAPVILVNGLLPHLDPATAALLRDLGTTFVDIAGGPGSVSPGIESDLKTLLGSSQVYRFTGQTRYDAAAAINAEFFPTAETAFLATGANFPDALAGAPLAGIVGGPIYLSRPGCIPQTVAGQLLGGGTNVIWLLGGPASLSDDVENKLTVCSS